MWSPLQVVEQKAGEVGVQTLVSGYSVCVMGCETIEMCHQSERDIQLVGESQAWHETPFLKPKDGSKGAWFRK